jgi:hypothetical protein
MAIPPTAASPEPGTREWENEGGSLKPDAPASLPEENIDPTTIAAASPSTPGLKTHSEERDRQ